MTETQNCAAPTQRQVKGKTSKAYFISNSWPTLQIQLTYSIYKTVTVTVVYLFHLLPTYTCSSTDFSQKNLHLYSLFYSIMFVMKHDQYFQWLCIMQSVTLCFHWYRVSIFILKLCFLHLTMKWSYYIWIAEHYTNSYKRAPFGRIQDSYANPRCSQGFA